MNTGNPVRSSKIAGLVWAAISSGATPKKFTTNPTNGSPVARMLSTVRSVWFSVPSPARQTTTTGNPNSTAHSRTATSRVIGTNQPPTASIKNGPGCRFANRSNVSRTGAKSNGRSSMMLAA